MAESYIDDASALNATRIEEIWPVPEDPSKVEDQLRRLLARASESGTQVSIAGARHTMGGHTIARDGIVINMLPMNSMQLSEDGTELWVQAGARWSEVIPYLDSRGKSVSVMQSNSSFSVGGSLSANCHGWQLGMPPIASTVRSFRLMRADGTTLTCSREQNAELFSLALGGYGLFGIILDAVLEVVPNERYMIASQVVAAADLESIFTQEMERTGARMVYGRLSISPGQMFSEAMVNTVVLDPAPDAAIPPLSDPPSPGLRRLVFRASVHSDLGKDLRWGLEKTLRGLVGGRAFSRNQLLSEPVDIYRDTSERTTDILHEYFVSRETLQGFLAGCDELLGRHPVNLLNMTLRDVRADEDTLLRYAEEDVLALVMLFSQERSPEAEQVMGEFTRELVEHVLQLGGTYYLPYRLHPTRQQFRRAYPRSREFFEAKRRYDPDTLFSNEFYRRYGE